MEVELVGDLRCGHGLWQVLLVREHQENCIPELVLGQHAGKFLASLADPLAIVAVNNEDEA